MCAVSLNFMLASQRLPWVDPGQSSLFTFLLAFDDIWIFSGDDGYRLILVLITLILFNAVLTLYQHLLGVFASELKLGSTTRP